MDIKFRKVRPNAIAPTRAHSWDAGYDLYSCEDISIAPMERKLIPVGIEIEIPTGCYGRIAPRSGLAVKAGIDVLAGVVDCGYRDEVKVVLQNLNLPEFLFKHPNDKRGLNASALFGDKNRHDIAAGDRIAQIIIERCYYPAWIEQETLTNQGRNGGFGSTGI
jgi:dUTP pyrophosphatase